MALCAKEMRKPFYVLAESFKFVRLYPLNQRDLPQELKVYFLYHID
jgi:translation initiation factor eIF-2B subunit alpha